MIKEKIYLISIPTTDGRHVAVDTIDEFESAILKDRQTEKASLARLQSYPKIIFLARVFNKIGVSLFGILKSRFIKHSKRNKGLFFTIMMSVDYNKMFPYSIFTKKKRACYIFDAWPNTYREIERFVKDCKPDALFVSSSQAADALSQKLDSVNVLWIPEGVNSGEYKYKPYQKKTIDILALGRKYEAYHEKIKDYFDNSDKVYLYEKVKGQIIFPTREEFIEGLSLSKISICVPSNITHPERSGDIETMTIRYLQSIVSKCLIVGHAPKEMVDMFGYNPVIEIDMDNPVDQLNNILNNYSDYIPLIERNYKEVVENHTWEKRWAEIKENLIEKN